ncbi:short-subunit dehydrogenase [Sphingomonas sp. PP-F2F-A104-K0414]|uniref:SDR family NAD(P)-dependent oxidoreductase n=1 Tax=Sphingomonas sp. PP-F2F-A104-K0414 TaxID=2135661 RepID=UPI0010539A17|nr:SDR family NAD(P)-dependent oxidoreductase [Sphingomonas sp. PP-F2F-A104-K0414]TCP96390.1 short-subunit dehydrogenase [Sphingomonas sp. PP-F2F-A104-K0414]
MKKPFDVSGRVALITGAGSGIGRAVAQSLAARGCNVALADIDAAGMAETSRMIGSLSRVTMHNLDVSNAEAIAALPVEVVSAQGSVDILVNNAGVAVGGTFEQVPEEDFEWLLSINLFGVIRMTRAFLPELRKRPEARLINVSSILGIVATPKSAAYCTSKFGVRGFSEVLRHELAAEGSSVGVSVVHPGGVRTAIVDNARSSASVSIEDVNDERQRQSNLLRMTPQRAGEIIVEGIEKRRSRILVGTDAKLISIVERIMPVSYWSVMQRVMK